jgi:hypothetical protein
MCIASSMGASVSVHRKVLADSIFASTATAYLLEMKEGDAVDSGLSIIGRVEGEARLEMSAEGWEPIDLAVTDLAHAWRFPLAHGGGRGDG